MTRTFVASIFLAATAFTSAMPAAAQERFGDGDRYAFTQDYEPSPALWRLADEDTTIYLLGTIHVLPRGFRWRSDRLDDIIDEVDMLVVETSDFHRPDDAIDAGGKLAARIARRTPTSQQLSAPSRQKWDDLIRLTGSDYDVIDNMPVLLALLTMGTWGTPDSPSSAAFGVESVLEREFIRSNRPIRSLEDAGEVMYSLFRLDTPELLAELDTMLAGWDGKSPGAFYNNPNEYSVGDAYWTDEHNWARGIVADEFSLGFGDGPIGRAFDRNLLDRRNTHWAEWLDNRLEEPGTILVAVGSGHFEGDVSVLVKLQERGLVPERID